MKEAVELLNRLGVMYEERETQSEAEGVMVNSVLTPEIRNRVADIEAEFAAQNKGLEENIESTEKVLRDVVLESCQSIKGEEWQVSWVKPRLTWDSKGLEVFAETYPQVLNFQKHGKPSTRITRRK